MESEVSLQRDPNAGHKAEQLGLYAARMAKSWTTKSGYSRKKVLIKAYLNLCLCCLDFKGKITYLGI